MLDPVPLGMAQLVRLHGADARRFAQAQFCSDVDGLADGDWQWSAWLDAKGRVRSFFALVAARDDELLAWLPLGDAGAMAAELRRFVFRSKLTIDAINGWGLRGHVAIAGAAPRIRHDDAGIALRLDGHRPRLVELIRDRELPVDADALRRWRGGDVADGLPLVDVACADEFVPQALELERLGAISFRKGCYPGQEIAARLHFRGGNKRRLQALRWSATSVDAAAGMPVHADGATDPVGRLLYHGIDDAGPIGLAVVSDAWDGVIPLRLGGTIDVVLQAP